MDRDTDATDRLLTNLKELIKSDLGKRKPKKENDNATGQHETGSEDRSAIIEIVRHLNGAEKESEARIVSLSGSTVRLSVQVPLKFSEVIELRVTCRKVDLELHAESHVNWMRPGPDDCWIAACAFESRLSEEILSKLQAAGIGECRRETRREISVPAVAHWQLEREQSPVVIRDYSEGGFCVGTKKVGIFDQKIMLRLTCRGESVSVLGNVRWHSKSQDENLVGCQFASGDDSRVLHETVQQYLETSERASVPD